MSIGDPPPEQIQRTWAYRGALWSMRVMYLCLLVWVAAAVFVHPPGVVAVVIWLAGLLSAVSAVVLLRLAGLRMVRRRTSWYLEGEISRNLYRDVFWLPRR